MIYKEVTVNYDPAKGPVVLVVTSGYASNGKFRASINDGPGWREFGSGDVADSIPDIFALPVSGESLADRFALVLGNYAPANIATGDQIRVVYEFHQREQVIKQIEIEERKTGVLSCTHLIDFEVDR